jgi:topoisomerase-4 subunit A
LIKRCHLETTSLDKKFLFISDHKASKLIAVTDNYAPNVQIKHKPDGKTNELEIIPIDELAEVRGWKALGSKLNYPKLVELQFLETEEEAPISEKATPEEVEVEVEVEEVELPSEVEIATEEEPDVEEAPVTETSETSDEPEFVVNFPTEKEEKKEEKEEIPFEVKNPPKGEQLGLF